MFDAVVVSIILLSPVVAVGVGGAFFFFFYQRVSVECRCRWDVGLTFFSAYETLYYEKTTQDQVQSNVYAVNKFQMPIYYNCCVGNLTIMLGCIYTSPCLVQLIYGYYFTSICLRHHDV